MLAYYIINEIWNKILEYQIILIKKIQTLKHDKLAAWFTRNATWLTRKTERFT